jgi:hypothetical protein
MQMVFSVKKIDYVTIFKEILNPEGHLNHITSSKVTAIFLNGGFCPLVELHREGCAPAACAAGLFFKASALWADAFYKSKCPSVCLYVCPSVCVSVHF